MIEGYNVRQLSSMLHYNRSKIQRIINCWLAKEPPKLTIDYSSIKHVMLDATYFKNAKLCLIVLMDHESKKPIYWDIISKENYGSVKEILIKLKEFGLSPVSFATDGLLSTIKAIQNIYPNIIIQRCMTHIIRQSLSWLRTYPKSDIGKELKTIVKTIGKIKSKEEQELFIDRYFKWFNANREFIDNHNKAVIADKDLKRTTSLLNNAISNMFHYINNPDIPYTTNALEGFFKHLKGKYRMHNGLSKTHIIPYLKWYCYYKSI